MPAGELAVILQGSKGKPWRPADKIVFTNSDPGLISLFLRFLTLADVAEDRVFFRLYIHESADVESAEHWWLDRLGVARTRLLPTSLKRHKIGTNRKNVGEDYHGCLAVSVRRYRELYLVDRRCDEGDASMTGFCCG
jgi:hypothetical protein